MSLLLWLPWPDLWHWTVEDSFECKDLNSKSREHGLNPGTVCRDIASGSQHGTDGRIIIWHEVKKGTVPSTHACCGEHTVTCLSGQWAVVSIQRLPSRAGPQRGPLRAQLARDVKKEPDGQFHSLPCFPSSSLCHGRTALEAKGKEVLKASSHRWRGKGGWEGELTD